MKSIASSLLQYPDSGRALCWHTSSSCERLGWDGKNIVSGCKSFIGNGEFNIVSGNYSSIIDGGSQNCIDTGSTAGTASSYNFIAGGFNNKISAGHSYSSILGGENNTVNHKCSSVSGYGITTNQDGALHANKFVALNMNPFGGVTPPGTLEYLIPTPALIAAGIPSTSCIVLIH